MGRYRDIGRYTEILGYIYIYIYGDIKVIEIWGDIRRYREIMGDREIFGYITRYREIEGDIRAKIK